MEGNCLELLFSSSEQPIWPSGFRPSNLGSQSIEQYQVPGTGCFFAEYLLFSAAEARQEVPGGGEE